MGRRTTALAIGAFLTAGGAWASETLRSRHTLPEETVDLENVPYALTEYEGVQIEVSERVLNELRSDSLLLREYARESEAPVWLYVDYHRSQRLGAQIHSPRNCYPGGGWTVARAENETLDVAGTLRPVCWLTLVNGAGEMRVALYWFETRWGSSSREIDLKIDLLRSAFARRPTDAVLVRVSADALADDLDECRARIERFLSVAAPHLASELPFARARA
jgi:EpsI family protein